MFAQPEQGEGRANVGDGVPYSLLEVLPVTEQTSRNPLLQRLDCICQKYAPTQANPGFEWATGQK